MVISFLARQKLRFDIGQSSLSLFQVILLGIAASDKITSYTGIETKYQLAILVPGILISVWAFGYILDKVGFYQDYQTEMGNRNILLKKASEK